NCMTVFILLCRCQSVGDKCCEEHYVTSHNSSLRTAGLDRCCSPWMVYPDSFLGGLCGLGLLYEQSRDDRDEMGLGAGDALHGADRAGALRPLLQRTVARHARGVY